MTRQFTITLELPDDDQSDDDDLEVFMLEACRTGVDTLQYEEGVSVEDAYKVTNASIIRG